MKPLVWFPLLFLASVARLGAVLIDEIQVYDDSINAPKQFGLELHVNTTFSGRAVSDYPSEVTPYHGIRVTPEFSYGLNKDFELGLYIPSVYAADHRYFLPGWKVRLKWIPLHSEEHGGWFAGSNGELSDLSRRVAPSQWTFESRNIAGWRNEDWEFATNLVFGWALSDRDKTWRPDAEIDVKISRTLVKGIAVGPEYYAAFGKLGRPDAFDQQNHTLYAAVDVDLKPFVFNFGIGRGVTHATDHWTAKAIFEIPW